MSARLKNLINHVVATNYLYVSMHVGVCFDNDSSFTYMQVYIMISPSYFKSRNAVNGAHAMLRPMQP